MTVQISSDAEADIRQAYWFYEEQKDGLGAYFRDSVVADIESLRVYAGIHEKSLGYHRMLASRFPFLVYYKTENGAVTVVAVLDARAAPSSIEDRLR